MSAPPLPRDRPIPGSYWVRPGLLLAGEYPCPRLAGPERMEAFLDAGIRSFVDLTDIEDPLQPYEGLALSLADERSLEVRYRRMAIRDHDVPTVEHMRDVLAHIDAEIAAGRAVYVHCLGGIGRTGTVVGCWMVEHDGLTGAKALERIAALRAASANNWWRSPETDDQCRFVETWQAAAP